MKLKTRMIITFFTIILVPLLVSGVFFFFFSHYQMKILKEDYGVEVSYKNLTNTTMVMSKMTHESFLLLQEKAKNDPGVFEQKNFLVTMNQRLEEVDSFLLIRKSGKIYYNGSTENCEQLLRNLPGFGGVYADSDNGVYLGDEVQALVKQTDFRFSDDTPGSAFIVSYAEDYIPGTRRLILQMVVLILVLLIITSLVLCIWVYRGVVTPINRLKKATLSIKEGNLDFTVEGDGVDEINSLCEDFEEMRQRLKESSQEKLLFDRDSKELISNISHDLKTPITSIKGYVEGIMDGVADTPQKMDRYIRTIYNKANEMDRLINELTLYSKIDTNRIPYNFHKIRVSDYFQDCVEDLQLELSSADVAFSSVNELTEDVFVIADAEQIKRVINNIVSNSLKYMNGASKKISIHLKDAGDFVQFEITDNGRGIAQKDLENIFDRFYRADASRNSSKGGSGIGLSIVKKILEDHGGKVWASSRLNVGTTIYFVLRKYQEVL